MPSRPTRPAAAAPTKRISHRCASPQPFPKRAGDLATFLIVFVLLGIGVFLGSLGACLTGIGSLVVMAWYMSFQLNIVLGAAAGDEELPTLSLTGGWWEDVTLPFIRMCAVTVVAWLPALAYLVTTGLLQTMGGLPSLAGGPGGGMQILSTPELTIAGLLLAAGYFLWPMLILVVAVGGAGSLIRVDLMVQTIAKSLMAYLLVAALALAANGVQFVGQWLTDDLLGEESSLSAILVCIAVRMAIGLYCMIISMRAIGLYYHHFKHRFAWSWG